MTAQTRTVKAVEAELAEARRQLEEAEETIAAIRSGAVDAFLISGAQGEQVYVLESADRNYRAMVEQMQQGALLLGYDGAVLYANASFATMVGLPVGRIVGAAIDDFVAPADRSGLDDLLHAAAAGPCECELTLDNADGRRVPARIALNPLPLGGVESLCAIVTDLTERKEHEALQRAQRALRESEARLRDADRRKDQFLATLAHELRNPLVPLRNGLKIMQLSGGNAAMMDQARAMMKRQVQHMVRLIDDLLDVSRITLGKVALEANTLDLAEVVRRGLAEAQNLVDDAGHEIVFTAPAEPLYVEGDAIRLAQVFGNLVSNAARYTPKRGRIAITVAREDREGVVRVADTGRGISPEALARVFDLFAPPDQTNDGLSGLGLGLGVSQQLIGMHGGVIEGRSEGPGQGSEFVVKLPLVPAPSAPHAETRDEADAGSGGSAESGRRRILVADDSVDAARSLALVLTMHGHEVRVAYDGAEAFEVAETFRPEVILLDISMPDGDGYDVCRLIRDEEWGRDVRIVAVTGWDDTGEFPGPGAGFDHHLVKPVDPDVLVDFIARLTVRTPTPS